MFRVVLLFALASANGSPQDAPVFRADSQLVQINVIVRDKNGPIANLSKGDFTLTDQGKTRTIDFFSVQTATHTHGDATPLPAHTFSNRGAETPASVTMILLDRLISTVGSSSPGEHTPLFNGDLALQNAKQHLLKFVNEMGPTDRVAVYSLGQSLKVLSDFTSGRAQLKTILQTYRATSITSREVAEPQTSDACPQNDPNGCPLNGALNEDRQVLASLSNAVRAQTTMNALMDMAAHVAGIPGRKNLVWLTSNLSFPPEAVARALSRSNIAIYPVDARGLLPVAMAHSATDIPSQFEGPPRGAPPCRVLASLSSGPSSDPTVVINTMQTLAEVTGGRAFIDTNDLTGAVREAIDDGAATYTLGFYVDASSLDDKFHKLKVHVKRPSTEVRTQQGYFALKDAANHTPASLLALPMSSPLESPAIHVTARVERTGDELGVSGSIDVRDLRLEPAGDSTKGEVEIYLVQQDQAGNVLERRHENLQLQFTPAQYTEILKSGILFHAAVKQKDGLATFRIVAADRGSATAGSLIIPVSEIR